MIIIKIRIIINQIRIQNKNQMEIQRKRKIFKDVKSVKTNADDNFLSIVKPKKTQTG